MSLTFVSLLHYVAYDDKSVRDALVEGLTCAMGCGTMIKAEPGWVPDLNVQRDILAEWLYVRPPGQDHVFVHDTICLGEYLERNADN